MKKVLSIALASSLLLSACTTAQIAKFKEASDNFNTVVAAINTNIAAVAPLVGKACDDLQAAAFALAPLVPKNAKAPQYFSAANGALQAYCQAVPTDIQSTGKAVIAAVAAARNGYYNVTGAKL